MIFRTKAFIRLEVIIEAFGSVVSRENIVLTDAHDCWLITFNASVFQMALSAPLYHVFGTK